MRGEVNWMRGGEDWGQGPSLLSLGGNYYIRKNLIEYLV